MKTAAQLQRMLSHLLREEIHLTLRGTETRPVRAERPAPRSWKITLHPCFGVAAEDVIRDLAHHLREPLPATAERLRRFVRAAREEVPARPRRRVQLQPKGRHHDLVAISGQINRDHFGGRLATKITWGRNAGPRGRRRRAIVFGSYDTVTDTVRIHPDLDSRRVPRHFVEFIVYHEMLHAVHPIEIRADGRRTIHTTAFKRAEQEFPHYERAMRYLDRWRGGH